MCALITPAYKKIVTAYDNFTTYSDVWSFGIVITYGHMPYPGMTNVHTLEQVTQEHHMPQSHGCPK